MPKSQKIYTKYFGRKQYQVQILQLECNVPRILLNKRINCIKLAREKETCLLDDLNYENTKKYINLKII